MQKNRSSERVGIVSKNRYGSVMEVVGYNYFSDIVVKFENGILVHTNWQAFLDKKVANAYDKSVYGVGYFGEGEYQSFKDNEFTLQYKSWFSMIERCYGNSNRDRYVDCVVCDDWLNFQIFAKWFDENYYEIEGQRMELDKDILVKGNKFYSPDTCVFVPRNINCLFTKSNKNRGSLPIGVSKGKKSSKYRSRCNNGGKETIYLGLHNTPEEAFMHYKIYKEKIIKQIAEEYKTKIPIKLYNAMVAYEVEITD